MQCNPSFYNGHQNYSSSYNPFGTTFPPQHQQYPEVIGEGEVTTFVLPDGSIQLYFLPVTVSGWNTPFPTYGCNRCRNGAVWFIRSVSNPTPHPLFNIQPPMQCTPCPTPFGSNFAIQSLPRPQISVFKFHNDAWTSSTDLKYFSPLRRPAACAGVQNHAATENRSVETEVNPNSCPSCGGDPKKQESQVECKCSSHMSVEENSTRRRKSKDKKRKKRSCKRKHKYSSTDYSSTDYSDSYMSISSSNSSQSKHKSKKGKKCQGSSTSFYSSKSSLNSKSKDKHKSRNKKSDSVICECRESKSKEKTKCNRKKSKDATCKSSMSIQTDKTKRDNNTEARGQCCRSSNTSMDSNSKNNKSKTPTESCMSIQTEKPNTNANTQSSTRCGCSSNITEDSQGILRSKKKTKHESDSCGVCQSYTEPSDKQSKLFQQPKSSSNAKRWGLFSRFGEERPKETGIIIRDDSPSAQNYKCQTSDLITSDNATSYSYNDNITLTDSKQDDVICPCDEESLVTPDITSVMSTCARDMEMWLSKWAHEFADAGKRKIDKTIDSCCNIRIDEID